MLTSANAKAEQLLASWLAYILRLTQRSTKKSKNTQEDK